MIITIPYGKGTVSANIPDGLRTIVVDPQSDTLHGGDAKRIEAALDHPIGTPRLEKMASPDNRVLIVVNDHTRPGPNQAILEGVLRRLALAGVPDNHIRLIVATGSHRGPTPQELEEIVGGDAMRRFEILIHDCRDHSRLVCIGQVQGLDIWLNRAVQETDFLITTGLISPHSTAGFSGGRKSILPGITGLDTLHVHHSLPMRPYAPSVGKLEGNRFHDVALSAAKLAGVRFMINAVQDMKKQNVRFVAGDLEQAHAAGVEECRKRNTVDIPMLADIVIAGPGGYPRDSDLYQAQKGLAAAEMLVKPGGTMILCCNGELGVGEGLFPQWMKEGDSPQSIVDRYRREGFNVGNNKAFMYARALLRGKVVIVSDHLDPTELKDMFLDWAPDLQTAVDAAVGRMENPVVTVLPRAVSLIPRFAEKTEN
ncbi:MAG: nickel-dependent lactate racemase [Lawsonibacter sp.]